MYSDPFRTFRSQSKLFERDNCVKLNLLAHDFDRFCVTLEKPICLSLLRRDLFHAQKKTDVEPFPTFFAPFYEGASEI